jgi:hypothetical protein
MTGPRLTAAGGVVSDEDRLWQRRAETFGEDPLRDVRSIAGRWSATIGALAGLFGLVALVSGPRTVDGLAPAWRVICGVLVLLVLLFAAAASWFAAAAAQGRVVTTLRTAARYRAAYEGEEQRARTQLRSSKLSTAIAGGLLIAAIAISWYAPRTPGRVLVVRGTTPAAVQCVPADGGTQVVVSSATLVSIQDHCP